MSSKIPTSKVIKSIQPSSRPFRIFALPLAKIPKPHVLPLSPPPNPTPTPTSEGVPSPALSSTPSPSTSSTEQGQGESGSAKTPLLLFQTLQPESSAESGPPSLMTKALNKASDTWLGLGKKPKNSWTFWFYAKGEKLMDRIEFEEWSLKSIKEGQGVKIDKDGKILGEKIEIPLIRPDIKGTTLPPLLPKLHRFLIHRIPYHRKMMYRSLIFIPVTWPFAIIPVIPNFPFFYVLWRAWSHYKAWRGASYVETLLQNGLIVEKESKELTDVYASKGDPAITENGNGSSNENKAPDETSSNDKTLKELSSTTQPSSTSSASPGDLPPQAKGETPTSIDGTSTPENLIYKSGQTASSSPTASTSASSVEREKTIQQPYPSPAPGPITSKAKHPSLLLSPSQIPLLAKTFDLKPLEIMDITRAVEQADYRARKADKEKADKAEQEKKGEAEKKGN